MRKRRNTQIILVIVAVIIFVWIGSGIKLKTVDTYEKEQQKLQEEETQYVEERDTLQTQNTGEPEVVNSIFPTEESGSEETKDSDKNSLKESSPKPDRPEEKKSKKQKQDSDVNAKKNGETAKKTAAPKKTKEPKRTRKPENPSISCMIEIDCSSLLEHMEDVEENMKPYIPANGVLLQKTTLKIEEGKSAYDCLAKACKQSDIALDAEYTPLYSGYYVKGIGYLYEKQAGKMSGWVYLINGRSANVGASNYVLQEGDTITWTYTCTGKAGS